MPSRQFNDFFTFLAPLIFECLHPLWLRVPFSEGPSPLTSNPLIGPILKDTVSCEKEKKEEKRKLLVWPYLFPPTALELG